MGFLNFFREEIEEEAEIYPAEEQVQKRPSDKKEMTGRVNSPRAVVSKPAAVPADTKEKISSTKQSVKIQKDKKSVKQKSGSIRRKIIMIILSIVILCCGVLEFISIQTTQYSAMDSLEKSMTVLAQTSADRIEQELWAYQNVAIEAGQTKRLAQAEIPLEEKQQIINDKINQYGFSRGVIVGVDGVSIFDPTLDVSDRDYFIEAMKGNASISDPIISKVTGKASICISAPLWQDGKPNTTVVGVVYFIPNETFLEDIVGSVSVSETGYAYLLQKDGLVIAHPNQSLVMMDNTIESARTDSSLAPIAKLEQAALNGENGFGTYRWDGVDKVMSYAPLDVNGWALGVTSEKADFMGGVRISIMISLAVAAIFIIIGLIVATRVGFMIGTPIQQCTARLVQLAEGDLSSPVPDIQSNDETGILAGATKTLVTGLQEVLGDADHLLGKMAEGDFNVATSCEKSYVGDFASLLKSMQKLNFRLSRTLSSIEQAAEQVAVGANEVASGAQALSQGTTEQASAVEELSATISDVSDQIQRNASHTDNANLEAAQVENEITESSQRMQSMLTAMDDISRCSKEIGKIIKTIEDIAFQTNILALNAAVEAARAGAAGKGFAVVADEVRNLASKSAEASKNTSALIEDTLTAVENGAKIANETAQSLNSVVAGVQDVTATIAKIAAASDEQAQSTAQVNLGVEQISSVVQTNSATAEQSAAASQELSGQAAMLKELVNQFTVNQAALEERGR